MRRFIACSAVAAALASFGLALAACSSSDPVPAAPSETDAAQVIPSQDGAMDAAPTDAGAAPEADTDAAPRICSDDSFCHSVVPKGQNLRGVWGDGLGVLWAISNEGNILRWDGSTWSIYLQVTTEGGVFSVFGTGPTDVWVPSDKGLLHGTGTTSATLVFAPVALPGDPSVFIKSVWGTGPNDLWAVGGTESFDTPPFATGRVVHYDGLADGGGAWTLDASLSSKQIAYRAVWGSASTGPWLHGGEANSIGDFTAVLMRRVPASAAWSVVAVPPDPSLTFHPAPQFFGGCALSSDTSLWLTGLSGDFLPSYWQGKKVTDGGTGFDFTYTKLQFWQRPPYAVWGTAPNDTWAVGQDGLVDHWDGTQWKSAAIRVTALPVAKSFWGIWGTSTDDFWVVGDEIAIHKTNKGKP
ncbi:MAG: hypothetical protein JWO86_4028 [Myxococcaceae bacterium]|nr:hypothetical protein [Myxococcaceae bacterium]MEA2752106.1 hypothetical protein [Myxococcales bacterium]